MSLTFISLLQLSSDVSLLSVVELKPSPPSKKEFWLDCLEFKFDSTFAFPFPPLLNSFLQSDDDEFSRCGILAEADVFTDDDVSRGDLSVAFEYFLKSIKSPVVEISSMNLRLVSIRYLAVSSLLFVRSQSRWWPKIGFTIRSSFFAGGVNNLSVSLRPSEQLLFVSEMIESLDLV